MEHITNSIHHVQTVKGSLEGQPALTDIQATAIDLYRRGFNVVPLKRHDKKPYILEPYFTSRLHHCDVNCHHKGSANIAELFARNNIGVVLGRTSGNLIDIDCDSHAAFHKMQRELTARSLPYWSIGSVRGGHFLMRVMEGEVANMPKAKSQLKDVEVFGNRRLCVIPPSIHPSGAVYQWLTPEPRLYLPPAETLPAVSIGELEWLGVTLHKDSRQWQEPELFGLPEWAAALTLESRRTFADTPQVGWRNNAIFNMACDMKANDIDYYDAEAVILDLAARAGTPEKEAIATLKSAYKKERKTARQHYDGNSQPAAKEWQLAKSFADSYDWRATFGRKALRVRAVYLALVERAKKDGRLHWRASAREVAELANVNKETVAVILAGLKHANLIRRTNTGNHAGLYRFILPSVVRTVITTGRYSVRITEGPNTQAEQDVFGKLGLVAWHVWRWLLTNTAMNAAQVARATGLAYSSVYKALRTLVDVGLVSRSMAEGGRYYGEPKTDGSLAAMAAELHGGASPSQVRKERHRLERELRVNQLTTAAIQRHYDRQQEVAER